MRSRKSRLTRSGTWSRPTARSFARRPPPCCRWRNATSSSEGRVSDWLTWQIVDSAFPTGMFAHSGGLESAWQHGEVPDVESLRLYADAAIVQAGYSVIPLLNAGFDSPHAVPAL